MSNTDQGSASPTMGNQASEQSKVTHNLPKSKSPVSNAFSRPESKNSRTDRNRLNSSKTGTGKPP
jgi:hypothetical protein